MNDPASSPPAAAGLDRPPAAPLWPWPVPAVVVMGVAGCGKSSVGAAVAQALGWPLIEGDDFHAPASMAKMRAGVPLTDDDRLGWLDTLGAELRARPGGAVLTCSALRRAYRDRLRAAAPGLGFVHLVLSREAALDRVAQRFGTHPFPPSLVDSQFATLESPAGEPAVLELDATLPIAQLGERVTAWLRADAHLHQGPQA